MCNLNFFLQRGNKNCETVSCIKLFDYRGPMSFMKGDRLVYEDTEYVVIDMKYYFDKERFEGVFIDHIDIFVEDINETEEQ